jgi:hypothetical protein
MAMATEPGAGPIKKLALALMLAFAVLGGAVTVVAVSSTHVAACNNPNGC